MTTLKHSGVIKWVHRIKFYIYSTNRNTNVRTSEWLCESMKKIYVYWEINTVCCFPIFVLFSVQYDINITCATSREMLIFFLHKLSCQWYQRFFFNTIDTMVTLSFYMSIYVYIHKYVYIYTHNVDINTYIRMSSKWKYLWNKYWK